MNICPVPSFLEKQKQSSCNKGTEKDEEEKRRETEYRKINERYEIWKKASRRYRYLTRARMASLTVEWLPDRKEQPGNDCLVRTLILGTYATENGPNYIMRAEVQLPLENSGIDGLYNYDVGIEFWRSGRANRKVRGHYVRDVAWHPKHQYLCGSVGNDKCLHVWDLRAPSIRQPLRLWSLIKARLNLVISMLLCGEVNDMFYSFKVTLSE
ncbi:histone-binding protein MSI1-like [Primulina tabacum]|uniref:histone-binding protein MSI1-like n=1 Tax=Primulina tabacum TaxID=48773 RepID=UPI003F59C4C4